MKNNIAIVGATGAVGRKMLETLHLRKFPYGKLTLLASQKSENKIIKLNDIELFKDSVPVMTIDSVGIIDSLKLSPMGGGL